MLSNIFLTKQARLPTCGVRRVFQSFLFESNETTASLHLALLLLPALSLLDSCAVYSINLLSFSLGLLFIMRIYILSCC